MACNGPNSKKVNEDLHERKILLTIRYVDYIEGLGDSGSFVVVGASHDKERGRQLGVSPAAWTTFYVGLQTNRTATRAQVRLFISLSNDLADRIYSHTSNLTITCYSTFRGASTEPSWIISTTMRSVQQAQNHIFAVTRLVLRVEVQVYDTDLRKQTIPGLPYTFSLSGSLETRPTYIFTNPMVFEV